MSKEDIGKDSKKKPLAIVVLVAVVLLFGFWFIFGRSKTYTVTFDSNGGTSVESQKIKEGKKAAKPASPTRATYVFAGWYKEGEPKNYDFDAKVDEDIKLVAQWLKDEEKKDGEKDGEDKEDGEDKSAQGQSDLSWLGSSWGGLNTGTGSDDGSDNSKGVSFAMFSENCKVSVGTGGLAWNKKGNKVNFSNASSTSDIKLTMTCGGNYGSVIEYVHSKDGWVAHIDSFDALKKMVLNDKNGATARITSDIGTADSNINIEKSRKIDSYCAGNVDQKCEISFGFNILGAVNVVLENVKIVIEEIASVYPPDDPNNTILCVICTVMSGSKSELVISGVDIDLSNLSNGPSNAWVAGVLAIGEGSVEINDSKICLDNTGGAITSIPNGVAAIAVEMAGLKSLTVTNNELCGDIDISIGGLDKNNIGKLSILDNMSGDATSIGIELGYESTDADTATALGVNAGNPATETELKDGSLMGGDDGLKNKLVEIAENQDSDVKISTDIQVSGDEYCLEVESIGGNISVVSLSTLP